MQTLILFAFYICLSIKNITEIILVPHNHDDIGWLKTPNEYYFGLNPDQDRISVMDNLDGIVSELQKDFKKTHIYAEISYFKLWWQQQEKIQKKKFTQLLETKNIEFVNGAVSINDEACTYYEDIIENYTQGHLFIEKQLGKQFIPKIGWQFDTYGHSLTQAQIMSQIGFNAWAISRFDYQDMQTRMQSGNWEHIQKVPRGYSIFTLALKGILQNLNDGAYNQKYNTQNVTQQNIQEISDYLVQYFKNETQNLNHTTIMHSIGDDSTFQTVDFMYSNWDRIINHINDHQSIYSMKLRYGLPTEYLDYLKTLDKTFQRKTDDFFPYKNKLPTYWSGYFSTRPSLKLLIKESGRFLQISRNFLTNLMIQKELIQPEEEEEIVNNLNDLSFVIGQLQHHSVITGTEMQRVLQYYRKITDQAIQKVQNNMISIFTLLNLKNRIISTDTQFCKWNLTQDSCQINKLIHPYKQNAILLNVYNPGEKNVFVLRIKVPDRLGFLAYHENTPLPTDIICDSFFEEQTDCDLYFEAELETLQQKTFSIHFNLNNKKIIPQPIEDINIILVNNTTISFKNLNHEKNISFSYNKKNLNFTLSYEFYYASQNYTQRSGAYILRTESPTLINSLPYALNNKTLDYSSKIYFGKVVTILSFKDNKINSQIKLYMNQKSSLFGVPEIETFLNSISAKNKGLEITLKIKSDISNKKVFYTDSNGLDMMERKLNYRPTFNVSNYEPIPGNFYPVTSIIGIKDWLNKNPSLYIINDRSQAGSSLQEGTIELLIQRKPSDSDNLRFSDAQNLFETSMVSQIKMRHYITNEGIDKARNIQYLQDVQPLIVTSLVSLNEYKDTYNIPKFYLPTQNNLKVNFQKLSDREYLIRYHNLNENLSLYLDLKQFNLEQMGLTGILNIDEIDKQRIYWGDKRIMSKENIINPLEIKTFKLTIQNNNLSY